MLTVQTYSRLHFGVLSPDRCAAAEDKLSSARWFGGVGLMIEQPRLQLEVEPAAAWSAEGLLAARALFFAQRFTDATRQEEKNSTLLPCALRIAGDQPEHAGLGSGTQLGLAVARALAMTWGLPCDLPTLARRVGRGLRSALGVYGFEQGGFLVEAGKRSPQRLAPLVARWHFPESWRLVLVLPMATERNAGLHGHEENAAFAKLATTPPVPGRTDALCRLVLLGLLPALVERDVEAFGEALYEFNVRVGEAFGPVQGGVYASAHAAEIVALVRGEGIRGVGQSSWGPTVFALAADDDRAAHLATRLRDHFALNESSVRIASACNHGAKFDRK